MGGCRPRFGLILPRTLLLGLLVITLTGCDPATPEPLVFEFDFAADDQGWVAGFADLPADTTGWPSFALVWGYRPLPAALDPSRGGLYISGDNHSDDLYMFVKRQVAGLTGATTYQVHFEIDVATDAPTGCFGVGGSPGESVYIRAGATTVEPMAVVAGADYVMNIDKGNQAAGGADVLLLGNLANGTTDCTDPVYVIKSFDSAGMTFNFTTGSAGTAWLMVGTDSGFEAVTSLYYTLVRVTFTEQ